jgi:flagellar capping protein FliD
MIELSNRDTVAIPLSDGTVNKTKVSVRPSDGTSIKGILNIRKYNRLSDFLNSKETEPFLAIYDALMNGTKTKVVIVNRGHITWAVPEE